MFSRWCLKACPGERIGRVDTPLGRSIRFGTSRHQQGLSVARLLDAAGNTRQMNVQQTAASVATLGGASVRLGGAVIRITSALQYFVVYAISEGSRCEALLRASVTLLPVQHDARLLSMCLMLPLSGPSQPSHG
jgi:hypothetical protein